MTNEEEYYRHQAEAAYHAEQEDARAEAEQDQHDESVQLLRANVGPPLQVRLALSILLNHVEPGWENCIAVVNAWLRETEEA
jgi:hypothetical protein